MLSNNCRSIHLFNASLEQFVLYLDPRTNSLVVVTHGCPDIFFIKLILFYRPAVKSEAFCHPVTLDLWTDLASVMLQNYNGNLCQGPKKKKKKKKMQRPTDDDQTRTFGSTFWQTCMLCQRYTCTLPGFLFCVAYFFPRMMKDRGSTCNFRKFSKFTRASSLSQHTMKKKMNAYTHVFISKYPKRVT